MRKRYIVFPGIIVMVLAGFLYGHASPLVLDQIGRGRNGVTTVVIASEDPATIYFGSDQGVFKSQDNAITWRNILSLGGQNKKVNRLLLAPRDSNHLFAATGSGLYASHDAGVHWRKIYKGKNYLEAECTAVALLPYGIYLGTRGGLLVSRDAGVSWLKEAFQLGSRQVVAMAFHPKEPQRLFVACQDAVYKTSDAGRTWKKIFIAHAQENVEVQEEEGREAVDAGNPFCIRSICLGQDNPDEIYLATSKGAYRSFDGGVGWEPLMGGGLLLQDIRQLLSVQGYGVLALAKSAIYVLDHQAWQELSTGYWGSNALSMSVSHNKYLYVAGENGLFRGTLGPRLFCETADGSLGVYLKGEPDIRTVQEAAIRYADTQPEKIAAWKRSAARQALLPQLSAGLNRNIADLWHWEGGSTTKAGDDCLMRGRDAVEWDIRFTWDLGQLLWNNDQTAIDARSRLMVELRNEVLDEVTKLYFERIRVKIELDNLKIEDRNKRADKELRLRELAASLDALTGGYYSTVFVSGL